MGNDYFTDASTLAAWIREGAISSFEVVSRHLEWIHRINPELNAIVTLDEQAALKRAGEADEALLRGERWGPLHGVPFTVKDSWLTAGLRTTAGLTQLQHHVPERDAAAVARLRSAGAVLLGKTNLPRLASGGHTRNKVFGRTYNPWGRDYTPGGSSGGCGVAVASGMTPISLGSDIGGSVRFPAHFCGIVSLKPSQYTVPTKGHIPGEKIEHLAAQHNRFQSAGLLARSVADLSLGYQVLSGREKEAAGWFAKSITTDTPQDIGQCRIAWVDQAEGCLVDRETTDAFARFRAALQTAGCTLEQSQPKGLKFDHSIEAFWSIIGYEAVSGTRIAGPLLGRVLDALASIAWPQRNSLVRGLLRGLTGRRVHYARALAMRDQLQARLDGFLQQWDIWMCPVAPCHVIPVAWFENRRFWQRWRIDSGQPPAHHFGMFTKLFSLTGHPVVVLPTGLSSIGHPVGIQLVGQRGGDFRLLGIAAAIARFVEPLHPPLPGIAEENSRGAINVGC